MRFIRKYNLELMSVILLIFAVISIANWRHLNWQQHMLTIYMILFTLHEWEETRFPGGFYDMMMAWLSQGTTVKADGNTMHFYTACLVLIVVLPGWFFSSFVPFLTLPVCLGCLEGCMHTAGIFIYHRKVPYTPGLCTALLLLITSIYTLVNGFGSGLFTAGRLILGLVLMIVLFAIGMRLSFRKMGISVKDLSLSR